MGITNSNKQIDTLQIGCDGTLKVTLALSASPDIASNPTDDTQDGTIGSGSGVCGVRNLKARVIAHNIDSEYKCCNTITTV